MSERGINVENLKTQTEVIIVMKSQQKEEKAFTQNSR